VSRPEWQPPTFDPTCTLCVRKVQPHDHPNGLRPVWPCLMCHDGHHTKCNPFQFCSCGCGLKETP